VWVQIQPSLRLWGRPSSARLTADTVARFAELRAAKGTKSDGDKSAVTLTAQSGHESMIADRAVVCLLERGEHASLERVSATTVSGALLSQLAPGFDRFPARVNGVIDALAAGGGWKLTLSSNPLEALPFLREALNP